MTRFGPRIEPFTFPTPSGCATNYAIDAGSERIIEITYFYGFYLFILNGKFNDKNLYLVFVLIEEKREV